MYYQKPILGAEGFLFCLVFAPMWLIVLGHFSQWFGAGALLCQHWRVATKAAVVALLVSFQSWAMMFEGDFPSQYFKLASMVALLASAFYGDLWQSKRNTVSNKA